LLTIAGDPKSLESRITSMLLIPFYEKMPASVVFSVGPEYKYISLNLHLVSVEKVYGKFNKQYK